MRILSWLLGEKKSVASADTRSKSPANREALSPVARGRESIERDAENLRRWRESGQAQAWVAAHSGQWNHDDWLMLLEELKRSVYWPMQPNAVGQVLEEIKREGLR